ncbi:SDR family oxidoreductase [Microvirga tunisiensis]|uniref:SDR family oxidoreductase n=1 Tax=Pannonibacter tanglangensis TaxID=2750084 RepID=A0A7X5F584_9HYPH|nr:SDR family oxidoreductase [Pannonibacter sp. XCT-53]NBN79971.1 SDR family oxidoreductase [Pannonibacter sp. XCT-53]
MDLGLNGKRALVLGASRGLGRAIAEVLAREGAHVIAAARTASAIDEWAAALPGAKVTALPLDLTDLAAIDAALDKLLAEGGVDILVNNIGGPPPGPALTTDRALWIAQFEAMAANLFHLSGRLIPAMQARKWGRVITIASSGVELPIPNLALSNGIRSAVVGWSKTLASEVARDGVTVNVVLPGRIHTTRIDELDAAAARRSGKTVEETAKASAESIPMGRYGRPEEFADMVAFLASERAGYVTGSMIRIDGGATRSH